MTTNNNANSNKIDDFTLVPWHPLSFTIYCAKSIDGPFPKAESAYHAASHIGHPFSRRENGIIEWYVPLRVDDSPPETDIYITKHMSELVIDEVMCCT